MALEVRQEEIMPEEVEVQADIQATEVMEEAMVYQIHKVDSMDLEEVQVVEPIEEIIQLLEQLAVVGELVY